MNDLDDDDIYAIMPDSLAAPVCKYCLCCSCAYLLKVCRICCLCEFVACPHRYCMWYLPYIFRRSPYTEWFQEIEQLRKTKIDLFDFKG